MSNPSKRFISDTEAADRYGYAKGTLSNMRSKRIGPRFYKRGAKVFYAIEDFDQWIGERPVLTRDMMNA